MNETIKYLSYLFIKENIYRNLEYPNPSPNKNHLCELDVAVPYRGFFLPTETKGTEFSKKAKSGTIKKFNSLSENFALVQLNRVKQHLLSKTPTFKEKKTNREITINHLMDTVIPLNITLNSLVGITTIFDKLSIDNFKDPSNYPISFSLKDLEIIALFSKTPEFFLAYLRYRLILQSDNTLLKFRGDEIDIFAAFCKHGPYWGKSVDEIRVMGREGIKEIDQFFEQIDFGFNSSPPDIIRKFPKQVANIISQSQTCNDLVGNTKTLVALYMFSRETLNRVEHHLSTLSLPGEELVYTTFREPKLAICIVVKDTLSREILQWIANLQKYISRVDQLVCIGIENTGTVYRFYLESPWKFNEVLEKNSNALCNLERKRN